MTEVYVQQMHREQPQVLPWQQQKARMRKSAIRQAGQMLGIVSIQMGERLVQWGEALRLRNGSLEPRVYLR